MSRGAFALLTLSPLVAWSLACAGSLEVPSPSKPAPAHISPPEPSTAPAEPASTDTREIEPWQRPFASKASRDVYDYYMMLPRHLFECEVESDLVDVASRDAAIAERLIPDGYLEIRADPGLFQVALFKDRAHQRDVMGVALNCGAGCMCNRSEFLTWNVSEERWAVLDVLPADAIQARVGADVLWWPRLPKKGTSLDIVGEDGNKLISLSWRDGRFVLP